MYSFAAPTRRTYIIAACSIVSIYIFAAGLSGSLSPHLHRTRELLGDRLLRDVSNATLGFQKILVINLQSRTDRRDSISLAADLTGLHVEYIPAATDVDEKARPPGGEGEELEASERGCWRSHLNAARYMVENNIQSALILEDDADWDVRIKDQMRDFARASRLLVQPQDNGEFLDPSYQQPADGQQQHEFHLGEETTKTPVTSPYGDLKDWDLFWLGHCGARFPSPGDSKLPLGRVVIPDETVPDKRFINTEFGSSELTDEYPSHTRVVTPVGWNLCSLGYGLSLPGARRLLYELGVHAFLATIDVELGSFCSGSQGRSRGTCLSVQPQLFQQHRPVGKRTSQSDINPEPRIGVTKHAYTMNVRWSARVNALKMIDGDTDYIDLFDDTSEVGELDDFDMIP